jgi:hypothetical protein
VNKSNPKDAIGQIIEAYRIEVGNGQGPISYRDFAAKLSEGFSSPVPHQSIEAWEKGKWNPSMAFLDSLANMTTDWRHTFASDLLAALYPVRFKPVGEIGKRILEPSA